MVVSVEIFDRRLKIDDPVGAISVHGICGAFGTAGVGLFAVDGGLLYGGGIQLLLIQFLGIASVLAFVSITAAIAALFVKSVIGLRVPEDEEREGLDIKEHGIEAKPGTSVLTPREVG